MQTLTVLLVIFLVLLSGLFSGLNLGLMSWKPQSLKRKARLGDKDAELVYPLRKNGNLLLTSLLLGNVLVNTVLSIFLGSLTTGIIATVVATGLIVIFGEIVPQSLMSKHSLWFGARTRHITRLFIVILYPICKPMSMLLNKMLGHELPTIYTKKELGMLVKEQVTIKDSDLDNTDYSIVSKGLEFSEKRVKDVMTLLKKAYSVYQHDLITKKLLHIIQDEGFSRIPVLDEEHRGVVGILYAKDLIEVHYQDKAHVRDVMRQPVEFVHETNKLDKVLKLFRDKRVHLFIVLDRNETPAGIITLEDVLEEIIGEIEDEYDEN
jgi:metal transporter CNNM